MTKSADFDAAVAVLRKVHVEGEELSPLAHAAGLPTARMATDLVAFLRAVERSVQAATRSEGRVFRVGAHGCLDEHPDLPPGFRLVPRSHP